MKILVLGFFDPIPLEPDSWQIQVVGSVEEAREVLATEPSIRAVLCQHEQAAGFSSSRPWIQLGGSAAEARQRRAQGWVNLPLDGDELALALEPHHQELNLRSVVHLLEDSFVVLDFQWRYLYMNEAARSLIRGEVPELSAITMWELFPEVAGSDMEKSLREAMTNRQPSRFRRYSPTREAMFEHQLYPVPQGLAVISSNVSELVKAEQAARSSEDQLRRFTELVPQMVWTTDARGQVNYLNRHWSEYSGLPREGLGAADRQRVVHPEDLPNLLASAREAREAVTAYEIELRLRRKDGAYRWHLTRAVPFASEGGVGWVGITTDIDDLKRAHHALKFLAEASQILASSLDYRETLSVAVKLAVPELADWVTVDLVEDGELKQLAVAHCDPEKIEFARRLNERYPRSSDSPRGATAVWRTGRPELSEHIPDELLQQAALDKEHLELLRGLGLRSYICVPLKARGRTLGVLTLVSAENKRTFGPRDLDMAEELASRAAMAIDNALLYQRSQKELEERTRQQTELHIAQVELEKARDEALRASRMKTAFLANMSHEIRTPMNGIRGMVEFLQDGELPPEKAEYVSTIKECADSLLCILNDILDLSRIEAGKLQIKNRVFRLEPVVTNAYALFRYQAEEKDLTYQVSLDSELPEWVEGDPDRIRQILVNLLSNAVKFTDKGTVHLRIGKPLLTVEVEDSGVGMTAETLDKLFQPFSQGDESLTRRYQGTGLGLSIVDRLVRLMGGTLDVSSRLNEGSRFKVSFPVQAAVAPTTVQRTELDVSNWTDGLDVLIVEDNPINRRVLALQLKKLKCEVRTVEDGARALQLLTEAATPDVILMDCQMPGLDGYETTRRLRKLGLEKKPSVIALTAHAMIGEREKCLAAGMDDFLAKPVSIEELRTTLSSVKKP